MDLRLRMLVPFLTLAGVLLSGCLSAEDLAGEDQTGVSAEPVNATADPHLFTGRLVCGVGVHRTTINPCIGVPGNKNIFAFDVEVGIQTLIVGMRWDATTDIADKLQLLVETKGYGFVDHDEVHRYAARSGHSTLVVRIDDDPERHGRWSWSNLTGHQDMQIRVYAPAQTPPGLVVDQSFEIAAVAFYGKAAPVDADPFEAAEAALAETTGP